MFQNNNQHNDYAVQANIQHLIKILTEHASMDPCTPIREYISNAHDASLDIENPKISIWGEGDKLMIEDHGVGMTKSVIIDAFTTIAGHKSQISEKDSVGMFGIGVLSAFMIAEKLEVITRNLEEKHGWQLVWKRSQTTFSLIPFEKEEQGTLAILHLEDNEETLDLIRSEVLEGYIKRTFALFSMPIFVGNNSSPVNTQSQVLEQLNVQPNEAKLISGAEIYNLMRMSTKLDLRTIYHAYEEDGTRIFLGIPYGEHCPLDLHKIIFYSKGVLIHGNTRNFFPENLSFVVGLIDHPNFHIQLTRETLFRQDQAFKKIKSTMESHILRFLELIANENRSLIEEVLRTHCTMLIAHAQKTKRLRDLFKKHYCFITSAGEIKWNEILSYATVENRQRIIHVSASEIKAYQDLLVTGSAKGFLTVYASGGEQIILQQIADSEGVIIKDPSRLHPEKEIEVPEAFRALAGKLNGYFLRKGVRAVKFINDGEKRDFPAIFRIRTEQGNLMASANNMQQQGTMTIDALMLNIANPLIRSLAGKKDLTKEMLIEISDSLYQIAILNSPFVDLLISNNRLIAENLAKFLFKTTGTKEKVKLNNGKAKCFIALPFNKKFTVIWEAVNNVLTRSPYFWQVIRGDHYIYGQILLNSIRNHLKTSHRLIADISGLNANVLIELGLMLANETESGELLILCDEETLQRLPTDLSGVLLAVYSKEDRANLEKMERWFGEKIRTFREFIAIAGSQHPVSFS